MTIIIYVFIIYLHRKGTIKMIEEKPLAFDVISQLRFCGHFLHYRMGERHGRRRILTFIDDHPEMLQSELQEILGIRSASISEMIISMEADGLVEKAKSEKDGRHVVLRLTPEGHAQALYFKKEYMRRVEGMTSCMTPEELKEFHRLLSKIVDHWQSYDDISDFPGVKQDTDNDK